MAKGIINSDISVGGLSFKSSLSQTEEAAMSQELTLTKGQAGTLSTRTSNTEGTATLAADHGITTGQTVDIYWTGGSRRGVTVGTVAGTSVPFSLGSGDSLPVQTTAIIISPISEANMDFTAEDMQFLAAMIIGSGGQLVFLTNANAELANFSLSSNIALSWFYGNGFTNPLSNESSSETAIGKIRVSMSGVTENKNFKMGILYDSVS